jgi:hypothetical protein
VIVVRTMTAIALALAASLAWGCSDFLGGLQTRRQHLLGVLLVSQAAGLAIVLPSRSCPARRCRAAPVRCGR